MITLTSKHRAFLRAQANGLETILDVGKEGVGENLIKQANDALTARELIKGRTLENAPLSAKEAAQELAQATGAQSVQIIGRRFVLYRANPKLPKDNRIKLP